MKRVVLVVCAIAILALLVTTLKAEAGTTGIIQGGITDAKSGKALDGVNVKILGTHMTTVSDAGGHYVFINVPPGTYDVTASLVGYRDATESGVAVLMDVTSMADLAMSVEVIETTSALVKGSRLKLSTTVTPTMYVITDKDEKLAAHQPNNLYQLPGLLLTMPGVVADPNGYATVRGGDMWYVGYMIEGIPISEPITNSFATNTVTAGLSKAELYTGGYKPEYGNALAGVVNQVIKTGDSMVYPGNKAGWAMDASAGSANYADLNLEAGGIGDNGSSWYIANYAWKSKFPGSGVYIEAPYSEDNVMKFVLPVGKQGTLSLLSLHGAARYDIPGTITQRWDPATDSAYDITPTQAYANQNYGVEGLTLSRNITSHSFYNIRLFRVYGRGTYNDLDPNNPYAVYRERESEQRGGQFDYSNQYSPKHLVKFGASLINSSNMSMKFANLYYPHEHFVNDVPSVQTSLYIQDEWRPSDRFTADYGLRYERMHFSPGYQEPFCDSQLSPRLGVAYTLNDKMMLRSSYGKFIMFPPTSLLGSHFDDPIPDSWYLWPRLNPERASTVDIGIERKLGNSLLLRTTYFSTMKNDLINYTYTPNYEIQFVNGFKGKCRGWEVLLQSKPKSGWSGWLSYTQLSAKASTIDQPDVFTRLPQDQRHTIALVATKKFKGFEISPYIEYGSGYPFGDGMTEYDPTPGMPGDEIPVIGPDGNPGSSTPNCYTAKSHFNLSLMIRKPITKNSSIYFAVQNILNTDSVTNYSVYSGSSYHNPDADHPNGYFTYEPLQRVPPRFIRFGYSYQY